MKKMYGGYSAAAAALLGLSVASGFACSSDEETPPDKLVLVSQDIKDGTLALHKGDSSLVGVNAFNASGDQVSPSSGDYSWISADPTVLTAKTLGSAALIHGESDWFDTVAPPPDPDGGPDAAPVEPAPPKEGHEPATTLRVVLGHGDKAPSTIVQVVIVIDAAGTWRANVEGVGQQELVLDQHGRNVSMVGSGTQAEGIITGNTFSLSQQGFVLQGTFSSRTDISGTYTGPGGITGKWVAQKLK